MWLHGSISCFMPLCGSCRGNHGMVSYDQIKHLNMNYILCSDFIYNKLIYIRIQPNLFSKTIYPFVTSTNSKFFFMIVTTIINRPFNYTFFFDLGRGIRLSRSCLSVQPRRFYYQWWGILEELCPAVLSNCSSQW